MRDQWNGGWKWSRGGNWDLRRRQRARGVDNGPNTVIYGLVQLVSAAFMKKNQEFTSFPDGPGSREMRVSVFGSEKTVSL